MGTVTTTLIKNPSIYYGIASPYIPIVNAGPTDLTKDWWNPEIKTLYDPCPYGYRIPKSGTYGADSEWTKSTWSGSVLTAGHTWKSSHFPASGLRNSSSGLFAVVGSRGFCWMSTPYGATDGYSLHFNSDYVGPSNAGSRSDGFPVRCLID